MIKLLHPMSAIESATYTPTGKCGNCLAPAYHPLEHICIECAIDHGLNHSTFTAYTYPSELLNTTPQMAELRKFFIYSN